MHPLEQAIREATERNKPESPPIDPEVALVRLLEAFKRIKNQRPFKVGDVITAIRDSPYGDCAGEPRIVIEIRPEAEYDFQGDHTANSYGNKLDFRSIGVARTDDGGRVVAWWAESIFFEPYEPK